MTNQGAVRMQRSAANPAARSASTYVIVPGNVPSDVTRARCQAIKPSAISVLSSATSDNCVNPIANKSLAHRGCALLLQPRIRNTRTHLHLLRRIPTEA